MEMAQRNKLLVNRKVYARLCRAFFFGRRFFWHKFEQKEQPLSRAEQQRQSSTLKFTRIMDEITSNSCKLKRLLGNGRLGSPKWNKQIGLVNTCRRIVSQICLFFYLGVYNLYFTKLKSRVTLYGNARGKRTLVEREVGFIWSLNIMSRSRNPPSQKERLLTRFQIQ